LTTIMDILLSEGSAVLYRVGFAVLDAFHSKLINCASKEEFLDSLTKLMMSVDEIRLMKYAFSVTIPPDLFQQLQSIHQQSVERIPSLHRSQVFYRPKIVHQSCIVDETDFEILYSYLPDRFAIRDPVLLFSSAVDGRSLTTLLTKVESHHPTLLLVKCSEGAVFGAFLTAHWKLDTTQFNGTGESFLFSLKPTEDSYKWKTGRPLYCLMLENAERDSIINIGNNGILIRGLAHVSSESSPTFQNPPLVKDPKAECENCSAIEVWGFDF